VEPAPSSFSSPPTLSKLEPASVHDFNLELLSCLTLCSPVGMTDADRAEWVKVARAALHDLPLDLLREGCSAARLEADHPAKIVPAIMRTVRDAMRARYRMQPGERIPPERRIEPDYVKPGEAIAILEKHGLPVPAILRAKGDGGTQA
jgi:hypothetical protein